MNGLYNCFMVSHAAGLVVPMIILSGYASPIDNMPDWLQAVTALNPARWFVSIAEGVFLKAMPWEVILSNTWPIMLIAAATMMAASALFRSRLE